MVYVGFSTPRLWNPLSALIRRMTRSRASHAFLVFDDPAFAARLVLEAHSTGYRLVGFDRFLRDNRLVALVAPAHPLDDGLKATAVWLGARFDVTGLVGIFLTLLLQAVSARRLRNPWRSATSLFCSESVVRTLQAARYPGLPHWDPESVTPQELLAFFEGDPGSVVHPGDAIRHRTPAGELERVRALVTRDGASAA